MLVLSHKVLEFTQEGPNGFRGETVTTLGGGNIQEVPDWVRDIDYFKSNVADKAIMEFAAPVVVPAAAPVPVETPVVDAQPEADAPVPDDSTSGKKGK